MEMPYLLVSRIGKEKMSDRSGVLGGKGERRAYSCITTGRRETWGPWLIGDVSQVTKNCGEVVFLVRPSASC